MDRLPRTIELVLVWLVARVLNQLVSAKALLQLWYDHHTQRLNRLRSSIELTGAPRSASPAGAAKVEVNDRRDKVPKRKDFIILGLKAWFRNQSVE